MCVARPLMLRWGHVSSCIGDGVARSQHGSRPLLTCAQNPPPSPLFSMVVCRHYQCRTCHVHESSLVTAAGLFMGNPVVA